MICCAERGRPGGGLPARAAAVMESAAFAAQLKKS